MNHPSSSKLRDLLERLSDSLPVALVKRFVEANLLSQAASLSFYTLLSLAPLLLLLLWLTASLYPPAQASLVAQVGELAGENAAAVAATIIRNASDQPSVGSLAGLWGMVLLLAGATVVFAQLQGALNLIFRTEGQRLGGLRAWLRKRVFSLGVVLALGFLLIVSMIATTAVQVAFARMPSLLPMVGYLTTLLLYAVAFAFLYHYLPDRRVAWRQSFLGGVITAVLFALGRYLIGLYLARAAPGSAYGSMGALVLLLVWMYYAAMVFFAGALITAVIDERAQARAAGTGIAAEDGGDPGDEASSRA